MAGATFSRVKNWGSEILTPADLNAEIDNILNNLNPGGVDDHSTNIAQMQVTTSPGTVGSESLATSLSGEIERLRYQLKSITGNAQWYESPVATISDLNASNDVPANRIISGRTRSSSAQPIFLVPAGTGNGATLTAKGTATDLVYRVDGTLVTIDSDVTASSLSTAPTTNNTATISGAHSKIAGEIGTGTSITIASVGTEITNLTGKMAGFKVVVGANTEYFIARVKDATTLDRARRGYFFDSTDAPIPRLTLAGAETLTLMRLLWVFGSNAGELATSSIEPIYSKSSPTGVTAGQYWFDLVNAKWKLYNGASFADANVTLLGVALLDGTDCIAARSFDVYGAYDSRGYAPLSRESATVVSSTNFSTVINVYGNVIRIAADYLEWDIASDLESGVSETANTTYYLYLSHQGDTFISDIAPYYRNGDLRGRYHPHQSWRALGSIENNATSDFSATTLKTFGEQEGESVADSSIEPKKLSAANYVTSASSGTFATSSASFVAVTNLSIDITTSGSGRPVWVGLSSGVVTVRKSSGAVACEGHIQITRDGSVLDNRTVQTKAAAASDGILDLIIPAGCYWLLDTPGTGTYTYAVSVLIDQGDQIILTGVKLTAFEL